MCVDGIDDSRDGDPPLPPEVCPPYPLEGTAAEVVLGVQAMQHSRERQNKEGDTDRQTPGMDGWMDGRVTSALTLQA